MVVVGAVGCGTPARNHGDGGNGEPDACTGLECRIVKCTDRNLPQTSVSGTVFAPNGTLALYGATVYIPNGDPGPLMDGVQCGRCMDTLPGGSVANSTSDAAGHFTLTNVPTGRNVPLIVQVGKWRRRVDIPEIVECQDNVLPPAVTSLPKSQAEGDIPKIAMVTGLCDALECLVKKLGVAPSEFSTAGGPGRIHLYQSNGASSLANGTALAQATTLWGDLNKLKQYDIAMFSCECSQEAAQKPQAAMDAMKQYADLGGRVFLSHYHNVWITGESGVPSHAPAVWPGVATCNVDDTTSGNGTIDQVNNPKGAAFATWMTNVMGSTTPGQFPITEGRQSCTAVNNAKAERWVYLDQAGTQIPQNFQFTTPNEAPVAERCGKVVFSDMHVASGSTSGGSFPSGCSTTALTPQEKALAFMFFDISSCVNPIF